ncbi:MAG: PAS domain S-box protein, partial [Pyrinomonadaceae bacterium]|nr:PAS domain S-box protein [Sphingobacteriaceae bacterium]
MDDKYQSIEVEALKKENMQLRAKLSGQIGSPEGSEFRDSQERFRTVFESSMLGNKIISPELKILQTNPVMVELLGYNSKEDIIGTRIIDYSPPEHKQDWNVMHENIWKKCKPCFTMETCLQRKDGSIFWCHVTSILFRDKEGILGYTIIEENTDEHNSKIEKEEFINTASHELKTPITSLKARLQIMNRLFKTETTVTDKLVKLSQEAELFTSKITHLVEDLLNLTRLDQGKLSLNKSRFIFSDALNGCCNHIQLNDKHHIKFMGDQSLMV